MGFRLDIREWTDARFTVPVQLTPVDREARIRSLYNFWLWRWRARTACKSVSSTSDHCADEKTLLRTPLSLSFVRPSATCCDPGNHRHKAAFASSCNGSFKDMRSKAVRRSCGKLSLSRHEHATRASMTNTIGQLAACRSQLRMQKNASLSLSVHKGLL